MKIKRFCEAESANFPQGRSSMKRPGKVKCGIINIGVGQEVWFRRSLMNNTMNIEVVNRKRTKVISPKLMLR